MTLKTYDAPLVAAPNAVPAGIVIDVLGAPTGSYSRYRLTYAHLAEVGIYPRSLAFMTTDDLRTAVDRNASLPTMFSMNAFICVLYANRSKSTDRVDPEKS